MRSVRLRCCVPLILLLAAYGSGASRAQPLPGPVSTYVADFVATAAFGVAMNDSGDVAGSSYPDPGCGSGCLPPLETVVWRGGERVVLPTIPDLSGIYVTGINAQGWVSGFAGFPGTTTHAVVWKPNGPGYQAIDLGTLPGTTLSEAAGIDDLGRVVGWSTTLSFPPTSSPFMWSQATGMVDLGAQGAPIERPLAISRGGNVAISTGWYSLDDPGNVVTLPPPPQGYFPPGSFPAAINNAGDQARFLAATSGENLVYLFRFHHEGSWQQLSTRGTGHLSSYGMGSINDARDVTATVVSTGVIAYGPDGLAEDIVNRIAPPYQAEAVTAGGPMNGAGEILTQVMVGRSVRLMRLVPADPCVTGCAAVTRFQMKGKFVEDPGNPGACTPLARNLVGARMQVTDEGGNPVVGATVTGRFLDDYWLDEQVTGTTNSRGAVTFRHDGPACVGAVAFLVTDVAQSGRVFDRTVGTLSGFVIPLP